MPKPKTPHYNTQDYNPDKEKLTEIDPTAKYVVDCWDSWDNYWSDKFSNFEKLYERWIGKPPVRDEEWQSQFHKRLTWQAEKALVGRFHSALFPVSAPIDTDTSETANEIDRILAKSLVGHWFKVGRFSLEFLKGERSAAIYGTGLFEDDWYIRKEQITEKVEKQIPDYRSLVDVNGNKVLDEDGNVKAEQVGYRTVQDEQKRLKIVEDRYRVKKANIFAWRVHPNKIDDDDDYPAIKQEFVTFDDLLERQAEAEKYGFIKFDNMDDLENDRYKVKEEDAKRLQKDGEYIDPKNPRIELLTYWGLYSDKKEDSKKPMWIIVANRRYVLRKQDNPYWHKKPTLFHIVWTEDEKPSYYGIGVAEIGADAEDRANTVVNIRTDIKKKNMRSGGWYNANDKKIKKTDLQKNIPGLMKPCSDPNKAIRYDVPPPLLPEDFKEEESATNDHREITGATTSLLPTADVSQQHKTLGGIELLTSQGLQRLKPDLSMMEIMGIRRIADRALLLSRQFMTEDETIEILASQDKRKKFGISKFFTMTPRQLMGGIKFFATGLSESINKMQNIDKLIKFAEMTGKVPQMQQTINYQAIAKRIALWLGFEDVEDFINPMPQGIPQGLPQGAPGAVPGAPTGPPVPNLPMVRPPMPIPPQMPQGGANVPQNGGGLPPQILMQIIANMQRMRGR